MFNLLNKVWVILFVLFLGCGSATMEFTSAKSATRAEKDLKRGEEWGLKALDIETDQDNALVPYFLATEIYKPQERWAEMADMLDEAIRRNSQQKLENPIVLDSENITKENILFTIEQGVNAYREETWTLLYNNAIELINAKNNK